MGDAGQSAGMGQAAPPTGTGTGRPGARYRTQQGRDVFILTFIIKPPSTSYIRQHIYTLHKKS